MERDITDLFRNKKYHELDAQEKSELAELVESEEEFEQMRNLFDGMAVLKNEAYIPKAETKKSLDSIFNEVHGNKKKTIWYNSVLVVLYPTDKPIQRRPLVQIAAAAVILLLFIPFMNSTKIVADSPQMAKVDEKEVKAHDKSVEVTQGSTEKPTIETEVKEEQEQTLSMDKRDNDLTSIIDTRSMASEQTTSMKDSPSSVAFGAASPSAMFMEDEATAEFFTHPDGIFEGSVVSYSRSAKQELGVLDLLTASF